MFTGSLLLALLFAIDWYVPRSAADPIRPGIDHSIMRIHSEQKWPDAVVIDSNAGIVASSPLDHGESPVVAREKQPANSANEAFAYATPSPPSRALTSLRKSGRLASRLSKRSAREKLTARDQAAPGRHLASEW